MKNLGSTQILSFVAAVVIAIGGYFLWQYNNPGTDEPMSLVGGQNGGSGADNQEENVSATQDTQNGESSASQSSEAGQEEATTEVAKLEEPGDAPTITLLRVEPDGSTIVAGSGPANTVVSLFNGSEKIGETTSEAGGDFAFVLDQPLPPGNHEIAVAVASTDGAPLQSTGLGLVQIPDPEKGGELTVLLSKPGEATQVLSKTQIEPTTPSQTETQEVAQAEQTNETGEQGATTAGEATSGEQSSTQAEVAKVELQAADIEDGKIYIAGTGEPGSTITLFMGKVFLGQTEVSENGSFLLEAEHDVPAGNHKIRADALDSESWELMGTTEVSLVHEPEPVKQEEAPAQTADAATTTETGQAQETAAATGEGEGTIPEVKEVVAGTSVIIRKGDSLWRVARRNYGRGIRYTTIFEANKDQIENPGLIYPGQVLTVPADEQSQ